MPSFPDMPELITDTERRRQEMLKNGPAELGPPASKKPKLPAKPDEMILIPKPEIELLSMNEEEEMQLKRFKRGLRKWHKKPKKDDDGIRIPGWKQTGKKFVDRTLLINYTDDITELVNGERTAFCHTNSPVSESNLSPSPVKVMNLENQARKKGEKVKQTQVNTAFAKHAYLQANPNFLKDLSDKKK